MIVKPPLSARWANRDGIRRDRKIKRSMRHVDRTRPAGAWFDFFLRYILAAEARKYSRVARKNRCARKNANANWARGSK